LRKRFEKHKQEEIQEAILKAAEELIETEGMDQVSIRKIAEKVGYSPGNIYQYFKGKDEIIGILVRKGYQEILQRAKSVKTNEEHPEEEIKESFIEYMKAALKTPYYFKAVMLSENPQVLKQTAILQEGVSHERETFKILREKIEKGIQIGRFKNKEPELTAQLIWTSTFGLLIRLIIERDVDEKQRDRLIEHHFSILFDGLIKVPDEKPVDKKSKPAGKDV